MLLIKPASLIKVRWHLIKRHLVFWSRLQFSSLEQKTKARNEMAFSLRWPFSHRASGQPKSLDSILTSFGRDVEAKILKYYTVSFVTLWASYFHWGFIMLFSLGVFRPSVTTMKFLNWVWIIFIKPRSSIHLNIQETIKKYKIPCVFWITVKHWNC